MLSYRIRRRLNFASFSRGSYRPFAFYLYNFWIFSKYKNHSWTAMIQTSRPLSLCVIIVGRAYAAGTCLTNNTGSAQHAYEPCLCIRTRTRTRIYVRNVALCVCGSFLTFSMRMNRSWATNRLIGATLCSGREFAYDQLWEFLFRIIC